MAKLTFILIFHFTSQAYSMSSFSGRRDIKTPPTTRTNFIPPAPVADAKGATTTHFTGIAKGVAVEVRWKGNYPTNEPNSNYQGKNTDLYGKEIDECHLITFNNSTLPNNSSIEELRVPHRNYDEYADFIQKVKNDVNWGLERGIKMGECKNNCGRGLIRSELIAAWNKALTASNTFPVGVDPNKYYQGTPPMPNIDDAPLNGSDANATAVCKALGCGKPKWLTFRNYTSPHNNTVVKWVGPGLTGRADWKKVGATGSNEWLTWGFPPCGASGVLYCSLPAENYTGPIVRTKCYL